MLGQIQSNQSNSNSMLGQIQGAGGQCPPLRGAAVLPVLNQHLSVLLLLLLVVHPHALPRQHMPQPSPELPPNLLCYEELLDGALPAVASFTWPAVNETSPCGLCYTSGAAGDVCVCVCPRAAPKNCKSLSRRS